MTAISRRTTMIGAGITAIGATVPGSLQAASFTSRTIRTNGIDMAVRIEGSGPPIVFLHGFPGLSFTWRHQLPAIARAGHQAIAPDLRGYGRTSRPAQVDAYDIANLTADVVGLLDALRIERAVLVGHDWGGLLAWQTALFHPARVAGAVGINAPFAPHWTVWLHPDVVGPALEPGQTFIADPARDPIEQMRQVYGPDMYVLLFQDGYAADRAMARDVRLTLRNTMRKNLLTADTWGDLTPSVANMEYYGQPIPDELPGSDVLTKAELDVFTERFRVTGFTPAINWYRNISRNWRAGRNVDQTIRVPSMVVSGRHDVVLRPSMADSMTDYVPDLERHVVEGSWHWTPEEKPAEVNRLLLDWLGRRYPARRSGNTSRLSGR